MTTITIDRAVIAQALAFVRWNSFGECRTPEWPGPPPTAKETADALTATLATQPAGRSPFLKERAQLEQEWATLQGMLRDQKKVPAWHDAPTMPGWWIQKLPTRFAIEYVLAGEINATNNCWHGRWFGPISPDKIRSGE